MVEVSWVEMCCCARTFILNGIEGAENKQNHFFLEDRIDGTIIPGTEIENMNKLCASAVIHHT